VIRYVDTSVYAKPNADEPDADGVAMQLEAGVAVVMEFG
jgi:hypothetical protein